LPYGLFGFILENPIKRSRTAPRDNATVPSHTNNSPSRNRASHHAGLYRHLIFVLSLAAVKHLLSFGAEQRGQAFALALLPYEYALQRLGQQPVKHLAQHSL